MKQFDNAPDTENFPAADPIPTGAGVTGERDTRPPLDLDQLTDPDADVELPPAIRDALAEQQAVRDAFAHATESQAAQLRETTANVVTPYTVSLQEAVTAVVAPHTIQLQAVAAEAARPLLVTQADVARRMLAPYDLSAAAGRLWKPMFDTQSVWRPALNTRRWLTSALQGLTFVGYPVITDRWTAELIGTIEPLPQLRQLVADIAAAYTTPWATMAESFYPKISWQFSDLLQQIGNRVRTATADPDEASLFAEALRARDAVLTTPGHQPLVRQFAKRWLGLTDVDQFMLDAVINALLTDGWSDTDMTDADLLQHLRRVSVDEHRLTRPIGERQLNRRRIGSLSTTVRTDSGLVMLAEVIPAPDELETVALHRLGGQWDDPRLRRLCRQLGASGAVVLDALGSEPDLTWREAAELSGSPPEFGETIRRKVRRLLDEDQRRNITIGGIDGLR